MYGKMYLAIKPSQAYADRSLESRGFIPMVLEDSLGGLFIWHVRASLYLHITTN